MIQINESLQSIFNTHSIFEKVYFKDFMCKYKKEGMNKTHFCTIMSLHFNGELSMSKVSDCLNLEKGSFTPVANKLINLGYIEKTRNRKDKRIYNLKLTDEGNEFAESFGEAHIEYVNGLLDHFSEEDRVKYFDAIKVVVDMTTTLKNL